MRTHLRTLLVLLFALLTLHAPLRAQSSAGTVNGSVTDPTGAIVPNATVVLTNTVSGYTQTRKTDAAGQYQFTNIPLHPYTLIITSPGFSTKDQRIDIRSSVPTVLATTLAIASAGEEVTVEATGELVENSSTFHTDIDRELFSKLPLESQSSSVSSLLTLASPGVAADSNGLFHGLGDHAQNAFYVDGQPITDQQSKVFSNQLPIASIQSLEVISGAPPAEYGEKTSLVANITTRSGQGVTHPRGEVTASYGSFGSSSVSADLSVGSQRFGNFAAVDFLNTGRFLDPSEFAVLHDKGNEENAFDRVDFNPTPHDTLHVNGEYSRSWFQTPNSYDNLNLADQNGAALPDTDQRAQIGTLNIAPFLTHILNPQSLVTLGAWVRRDAFNYYPSGNPLSDFYGNGNLQTSSISQARTLTNTGARLDYSYARGIHNLKIGGTYQQTLLNEAFNLSIVDPFLNSPCVDASGSPVAGFNDPNQCVLSGYTPNIATNPLSASPFNPLLACLDLTRPNPASRYGCNPGIATPFLFRGHTDVKLLSLYAQDSVTKGNFSFNFGMRGDFYNALAVQRAAEPRAGISYAVKPSHTVLRLSYSRSMETPFNENLVLSARGCDSAVIAALVPCIPNNFNPGWRNEFHAGFEQSIGKHLVIDADYIWKYTHGGYDFSVLGATPITFPIGWHNSKISGFALRATVPNYKGFTAFVVMSSVAARFFPPQIGGLGATNDSGAPFRIDHDEKFNQTTNLQYQYHHGPYISMNWRFDSGLVAGAVPFATDSTTPVDLSGLTGDQQLQAGLMCGTVSPTLANPLTSCAPSLYHSSLVSIPAPGTENDDHNPPRIAPRNLFDLAIGHDNLFHGDTHKWSATLTATNLTNKVALYNFLSTFSGTHYVSPRTLTAEVGFHF